MNAGGANNRRSREGRLCFPSGSVDCSNPTPSYIWTDLGA